MYVQSDFGLSGGEMAAAGGILAALAAFALIAIFIAIALYVYTAFAWMVIAQKLQYKNAWLAWIPIANFFLLPILAKKHWAWGFVIIVPILNFVMAIIWMWNIFEQRKYPGYLALIPIAGIVPIIGWLATLGFMVVIGMVAWKDR